MPLSPCTKCGGALRRSHRKLVERLLFAEAFRCQQCKSRTRIRSWELKYAHYVKCPRCHSVDLTCLKRRDSIDRMQPGFLNFLNKLAGGKLYHCWFCRLQFYDLRQRYNSERGTAKNPLSTAEQTQNDLEVAS